jgi:hypothetical protein
MKTQIAASSPDTQQPYLHLVPIVECLLTCGNQITESGFKTNTYGFYCDKDGWKCDLKKPIDFEGIRTHFELPKSIELSEKWQTVFCRNAWIEIRGNKA